MQNENEKNTPVDATEAPEVQQTDEQAAPNADDHQEGLSLEQQLDAAMARLAELEIEVAQHKDRALRAVAEAENARRIAQRDRDNAAKYAAEPLAKDLLEVAENLKRALDAVPAEAEDEALGQLVSGVSMVQAELAKAFAKNHIEIIDPVGEAFDPNRHQAMGEMVTDAVEPGKVAICFARGYQLRDRLLRPAMVQLARAPQSE